MIGVALISALFMQEIRAAVEVWNASTAYSHCYLILPMTLYLLWERRDTIAGHRVAPEFGVALLAVPLTLFWLVAERLGIMEARQLAVVAGFELLFLTVLGRRLYGALSGPLLFLFFLVPFGAFMTPALQQFTARFSIVGLNLLGIPNYSDKFTIETPAGVFFVAEACAGLRFLIAAIAFGTFYSLLNYRTYRRRILFIAASIVVPILANGIRALGIVVLGQVLGSAEAAAADHIIYGWVFFSVVMLLLIAGGQAFRESSLNPSNAVVVQPPVSTTRSPVWVVAGLVAMLGVGPALAGVIDWRLISPVLPEAVTVVAPPGCVLTGQGGTRLPNRQTLAVVCGGTHFDASVTAFPARSTSSAMTSERRGVTQEVGAENASVSTVETPEAAGRWTIVQTTEPNRVTAYAAWVDGLPMSGGMAGRVAQARDSVFGSAYAPVLITITAAEPVNSSPAQRKDVLDKLTSLLQAQSHLSERVNALAKL